MYQKLSKIFLAIIPIALLFTLIYSIITVFTVEGSQNIYSFLGQIALIVVWICTNLYFKKYIKNKTLAICLTHIIFQVLLWLHIIIYQFSVMQSTHHNFVDYLCFGYIFVSFIALIIMIFDLVSSVIDIKAFKFNDKIEPIVLRKLKKIILAIVPIMFVWTLFYGLIIISFSIDYLTIYNFVGLILLAAVWFCSNIILNKQLSNKKLALIVSQIIFQALLWILIICSIIFIVPTADLTVAAIIYQYSSLCAISLVALGVLKFQLSILRKIAFGNDEKKASA